jgi:hypothetical protein
MTIGDQIQMQEKQQIEFQKMVRNFSFFRGNVVVLKLFWWLSAYNCLSLIITELY